MQINPEYHLKTPDYQMYFTYCNLRTTAPTFPNLTDLKVIDINVLTVNAKQKAFTVDLGSITLLLVNPNVTIANPPSVCSLKAKIPPAFSNQVQVFKRKCQKLYENVPFNTTTLFVLNRTSTICICS